MAITHPNPRTWLQVVLGYGLQPLYGTPLLTLPKWLWAAEKDLGGDPKFEEFAGAFGGGFLPLEASIYTHSEPGGSFSAAATADNLGDLLPWATQGAFAAGLLSYNVGIAKYFTFGLRDHPLGRDIRVADAVPVSFSIKSGVDTGGILVAESDFFGEQGPPDLDSVAGTVTFSQASPPDKEVFPHNTLSVIRTDGGPIDIGTASVRLDFGTGFFPWPHNSRTPLARKDGPLNIAGSLTSIFSDRTDPLRRLADANDPFSLSLEWPNLDGSATLTVLLPDCKPIGPPRTGIRNLRYVPFVLRFANYGTPTITLI